MGTSVCFLFCFSLCFFIFFLSHFSFFHLLFQFLIFFCFSLFRLFFFLLPVVRADAKTGKNRREVLIVKFDDFLYEN